MIEKRKTCKYCGAEMESVTAKKQFCSDLHRVYWNREQKLKPNIIHDQIPVDGVNYNRLMMDEVGQFPNIPDKRRKTLGIQSKSTQDAKDFMDLEKIKADCPAELKGLDRTLWIQEQREKHNL